MTRHDIPPLLITTALSVGYGQGVTPLFKNLNLQLHAGRLTCFMGPNGIGKSTLIRTVAGLQPPLSGVVQYFDKPSGTGTSPKDVALVLTDRITAVNMTVKELVTFGRYPYLNWGLTLREEDKQLIEQALAEVRIKHLEDRKLYELSDGQLQMAMIARALAQNTPIILLDEPTAHLDLNNRLEVMNLLRSLARTLQKAILVATHELDLALQTADTIWLTGREQNILQGIPEDLVLSGTFDEIFMFKGFDLKTGKVQHKAYRNHTVAVTGDGHAYLWTCNALERNGYPLTSTNPTWTIAVKVKADSIQWTVNDDKTFTSLESLLDYLQ